MAILMELISKKWVSFRTDMILEKMKKVTRGQLGGIWGVFQSCNVSLCKQLTNTQGCGGRSVVVIRDPCMDFPKAVPLVMH